MPKSQVTSSNCAIYDYDQPSDGFEDTIDIYLGENSKKLEERYHEFLKRDLFLCKL